MRNFLKEIRDRVLLYDGSKGYMLQLAGLKSGECAESWNITNPGEVSKVYRLYKNAGCDVIQSNTFPGNRIHLKKYSLESKTYEINYEGARLAREVMGKDGFVAASIGPTGLLFEPSGELTFDMAFDIYKEQVTAVIDGGADIINFETFTDLAEMRAALIAAREVTKAPVICSLSFESHGKTLMGTDPATAVTVLKALGADMVGTNCSLGPAHLLPIVKQMYETGSVYLSVKPNAGMPAYVDGKILYNDSPDDFAAAGREFVKYGVRLVGGCCGTTPQHIKALKAALSGMEAGKILKKTDCIITSGVKLLNIGQVEAINLGHINISKGSGLYQDVKNEGVGAIADTAIDLASEGYDAIFINTGKIDESDSGLLAETVNAAQGYIKEPFIIETDNAKALDAALRLYKGKAGIVLNGFPDEVIGELVYIAAKYGSTVLKKSLLSDITVSRV